MKSNQQLTKSHGEWVLKDEVQASEFIQKFSVPGTGNAYFDGTFEELRDLVIQHFDDFEPGTGSVNNDVILVNIPADNVKTTVTKITPENQHRVIEETHVRQEGEKPVTRKVMVGKPVPAQYTQVVLYRADVLSQDNARSTDAEWEMIAVLGKLDAVEPMHPETMLRNSQHDEGGTYREYTEQEWQDAYEYWDNHAYLVESVEEQ